MSFAKPETKKDDNFDAVQKLMCSVHGCPNRWSVHMDGEKPKCSKHQWQKTDKKPPVQSWHDVGEQF
jgi:hypothetical protein